MSAINQQYLQLRTLIKNNSHKEIIVVCVGTDRSTGDSLGPLVGTILQEKRLEHIHVFGTIDYPVHAVNLHSTLDGISKQFRNPYVIGIDATLGRLKAVGEISVHNRPLRPGAGLGKELPEVGECSITGTVNVGGFMEIFVLQNTRLSLVMKMAKDIAELIILVDKYLLNIFQGRTGPC
ncbi:spore protease YyaC [Bacillus sp. RO3]|nr:spore protease YyaC [Bacillus sp. RO3]